MTTRNYDCLTCFGGQPQDNEDNVEGIEVVHKFKDIEKLLRVAKMMDITDILSGFKFGYESDTSQIINGAPSQVLSVEERYEMMKTHWKPTLHFKKGFCYTFEPKSLGQRFPVYDGEDLLRMHLYFDVSYVLSHYIVLIPRVVFLSRRKPSATSIPYFLLLPLSSCKTTQFLNFMFFFPLVHFVHFV